MSLAWDIDFSKRLFRSKPNEKYETFLTVIAETVKGLSDGAHPCDEDAIDQMEEVILDLSARHFTSEIYELAEGETGSSLPFVINAIRHVRHTAQLARQRMNGHRSYLIKGRELRTADMSDCSITVVDWLWRGHLARGKMELLSGLPACGKSQIQCCYHASVTACRDWPDGTPGPSRPGNTLMLFAEDHLTDTVVPRLIAAGADLKRVKRLKDNVIRKEGTGNAVRYFILKEDIDLIEQIIIEEEIIMMSLDPITAYLGKLANSNALTDVRNILQPLKELAERTNVAISALTHPSKGSDGSANALNHFIGSQAFIAVARIGHLVLRDTANQRYLFTNPKNNSAQLMKTLHYNIVSEWVEKDGVSTEVSRISWGPVPLEITADEAIAQLAGKESKAERQAKLKGVDQFLAAQLVNGPIDAKELRQAALANGFSWDQCKKAMRRLDIEAKRIGGLGADGKWIWGYRSNVVQFPSPEPPTMDE